MCNILDQIIQDIRRWNQPAQAYWEHRGPKFVRDCSSMGHLVTWNYIHNDIWNVGYKSQQKYYIFKYLNFALPLINEIWDFLYLMQKVKVKHSLYRPELA
jgi:hypothetical protein